MRLVVDTNVIISALIKDSISRWLLTHLDADLLTISFSDHEVEKYRTLILKKSKITGEGLEMILSTLRDRLVTVPDALIQSRIGDAKRIMDAIDPDDTPFVAAALATDAGIWSDDAHFLKQKKVKVWKTKDLTVLL